MARGAKTKRLSKGRAMVQAAAAAGRVKYEPMKFVPICIACNSEDIEPVTRDGKLIAYHCRSCGFNNRRTD